MSNYGTELPERVTTGVLAAADRSLVKPPSVGKRCAKPAQAKSISANSASANPIEQIIVPADFSPADLQLVHKAVMLGDILETKVTILHVLDINDPRWANYCGCAADFMRRLKTDAEQQMQELMDHLAQEGIVAESLTVEGLPAREILNVLQQASLLVLRSPIAKPFWRLFSKRTPQQVLEEARCTLMLCPS